MISIDEQLEKVGNQFGVSFMDELYRRLELVVMHFQLEFEEAMKNSFERHNVIKENLRAFLAREFERFQKNQDKKQTEMRLDVITTWNINNYPQSIEILDTDYQKIISDHVKKLERWSGK